MGFCTSPYEALPEEEEAESQDSGWRSSWPTWGTDILPHPYWLSIAQIGVNLGHLERHQSLTFAHASFMEGLNYESSCIYGVQ